MMTRTKDAAYDIYRMRKTQAKLEKGFCTATNKVVGICSAAVSTGPACVRIPT